MNWFEMIGLWVDSATGDPPITWNPTTERFEILLADPGAGNEVFSIYMPEAGADPSPSEDGEINFNYTFGDMYINGGTGMFLQIVDAATGEILSSTEIEDGLTGQIIWPTTAGKRYQVTFSGAAESYHAGYFYNIDALLVPASSVIPPAAAPLPWWYCQPKPPTTPCPTRPTAFVPFKDYDADFKYPLGSSRVPRKDPLGPSGEGCATCSPELVPYVVPEPEPPEPECVTVDITGGGSNYYVYEANLSEIPSWFVEREDFTIAYGGSFGTYDYTWSSEDGAYIITEGETFYGPLTGSGILTQGSNSICITWSLPGGA